MCTHPLYHATRLTPSCRTLRLLWNSPRGRWTCGASFVSRNWQSLTLLAPSQATERTTITAQNWKHKYSCTAYVLDTLDSSVPLLTDATSDACTVSHH